MDDTVGGHVEMELQNQKAILAVEVDARKRAEIRAAKAEQAAKDMNKQLQLDRQMAAVSEESKQADDPNKLMESRLTKALSDIITMQQKAAEQ